MVKEIKYRKSTAILWTAILFLASGANSTAWAKEARPDNGDYQACWHYAWKTMSNGLIGYDDSFRILARKLCNASPAYGLSVPQKRELRECLVDRSYAFRYRLAKLNEELWHCLTSIDIANKKATSTYLKIMEEQDPNGDFYDNGKSVKKYYIPQGGGTP